MPGREVIHCSAETNARVYDARAAGSALSNEIRLRAEREENNRDVRAGESDVGRARALLAALVWSYSSRNLDGSGCWLPESEKERTRRGIEECEEDTGVARIGEEIHESSDL